jgi:pSer/pThr/pTyr-binding forkhead associated (FHA) protein
VVAWLELPDGELYVLKGPTVSIGRDRANDLAIVNDTKISRAHVQFRWREEQWILVDLGSSNGTMVNGHGIGQHPLRDGDRITFGNTTVVYMASDDENATEVGSGMRGKIPELSPRERQVITLIAQGLTDREIAERLFISVSTVRSHLDRIADKTGFRRRAELTRLALELGVVT